MRVIAHLAAGALVMSVVACGDRREDSNAERAADDIESAAAEAGEEVRETGRDLRGYTYDRRDEFRGEVRRQAEEIDAEIAELGRDTRGAAGTVSEQAMDGIRSARAELSRRLDRVDDAAEDNWAEARSGVEDALTRLRQAIADVRRTEGPMGGRSAGQG
ncbi:MAG TPA: hypothetical protein VMN37_12150 [Gemmatimonadales bacterium]|nr:hypothetical protein [Gemmatimonadales bacterium]